MTVHAPASELLSALIDATKGWQQHKVWAEDPVMLPFRNAADNAKFPGHPGPAGRKAAEGLSKYILIDMYGLPDDKFVRQGRWLVPTNAWLE